MTNKLTITVLFSLYGTTLFAQITPEILTLLKALKTPKQKISCTKFKTLHHPFLTLTHNIEKKEHTHKKLKLSAIMNQEAYINQQWYKKKDTVSGYLITNISHTSVFLKKENKVQTLHLHNALTSSLHIQ